MWFPDIESWSCTLLFYILLLVFFCFSESYHLYGEKNNSWFKYFLCIFIFRGRVAITNWTIKGTNMNSSVSCTGENLPELQAMCTYFQNIAWQYYQRMTKTNGSATSNDTLQDELNRGLDNAPVKQTWFQVAIAIISVLGVIGNLLNLTVLTKRRLLSSMDILEKSATHGLVALAISDMLFCAMVFPHCFIDEVDMVDESHLYRIYYKLYGISLVNLFLITSTWLIVTMSVSRYLVVVYPLHARLRLTTFRTLVAIVLVFHDIYCHDSSFIPSC